MKCCKEHKITAPILMSGVYTKTEQQEKETERRQKERQCQKERKKEMEEKRVCVVYFDQQMGALHALCFLKLSFSPL